MAAGINYSKWDSLEVSDSEDEEEATSKAALVQQPDARPLPAVMVRALKQQPRLGVRHMAFSCVVAAAPMCAPHPTRGPCESAHGTHRCLGPAEGLPRVRGAAHEPRALAAAGCVALRCRHCSSGRAS